MLLLRLMQRRKRKNRVFINVITVLPLNNGRIREGLRIKERRRLI